MSESRKDREEYYTYQYASNVYIMSLLGCEDGIPCTVVNCYMSDKYNHPSAPHKRYGVLLDFRGRIEFMDVCEKELSVINTKITADS